MKIIDVPLRAKVFCHGDLIGASRYIILEPLNYKVTHLVVSPESDPYFDDRLIPIEWVQQSSFNEIELSCGPDKFNLAERFTETKSASEIQHLLGYYSIGYPTWPGLPAFNLPLLLNKRIPRGELAVQRETEVLATDGKIGYLDEFVISSPNYRILQLILRHGHLLGRKEIALPVADIEQISGDGTIHLDLDQEQVERFPPVELHRSI
ncbi:MAG: PRC-barrel domain-containing protein [Anaerolineaceae bacterium]|nr:PRC-barrel domain-containing protein [Anaerolineaceae bacterium]